MLFLALEQAKNPALTPDGFKDWLRSQLAAGEVEARKAHDAKGGL